MNELMNACPIIRQKGGSLFTTSIDVAEKFGKRHKNVLQAILALECSDEFNRLNFQPVKYVDEKGEQIFYKDIYQLAKQRIESFAVAIPRSNVIAIQASLPGRFHPQPMEATA